MTKQYKIVHRQFGSYPYWCDTKEEAEELLLTIAVLDNDDKSQYYIREMSQ